jgi:hypothetical protein
MSARAVLPASNYEFLNQVHFIHISNYTMGLRNKNISTECVTVTTLLKMFKTIRQIGYESAANY